MCTLNNVLKGQLLEDELWDYAEVLSNASKISKDIVYKALSLKIPKDISKYNPVICLEMATTFRILVLDNDILKVLILDKECNVIKDIPTHFNVCDRLYKIIHTLANIWNKTEPTTLTYIRDSMQSCLDSQIFEKYGELKSLPYNTLKEIADFCNIKLNCTKIQQTVLETCGKNLDTKDRYFAYLKHLRKINEPLCYQLFLHFIQRFKIPVKPLTSMHAIVDAYEQLQEQEVKHVN